MPFFLNIIALSALVNLARAVPTPQAGSCSALPPGHGPVPANDESKDFYALQSITDAATSAATPSGYARSFLNGKSTYNGHTLFATSTELEEYDVQACADACNAEPACSTFNIFFERSPLLVPGPTCPNPPSTTRIKCTLWRYTPDSDGPMNDGQYQQAFHVVMAGSNSYVKDGSNSTDSTVPFVNDFNTEVYTNAAIDAPLDCNGHDTYLGLRRFVDTKFDFQRCADSCTMLGDCQFINAYVLRVHNQPFVQHCAFYSKRWPVSFATNTRPLYVGDEPSINVTDSYGLTKDDGIVHDACVPEGPHP